MPGPCSAPNGQANVNRTPKDNENITTGKTKLKGTRKPFDQHKDSPDPKSKHSKKRAAK